MSYVSTIVSRWIGEGKKMGKDSKDGHIVVALFIDLDTLEDAR